ANLGAMLMQAGIPYDSEEGRAVCAALTSIMCGRSYRQSAEMAKELGAFPGYDENKPHMLRVMRNHRRAAHGVARNAAGRDAYEALKIAPVPLDHAVMTNCAALATAKDVLAHATKAWDDALALGEKHGYRNAQV